MARILITITKQNDDPWILIKRDLIQDIFSQEEIDNTIKPYFQYIKALPGYIYEQSSVEITGNTSVSTMVFDTIENAANAYVKLYPANEQTLEQVVKNKNQLIKQKMQEAGVHYSFSAILDNT